MSSVTYEHVYKRFGDVTAVNDLDIEIVDKEFLVFVGPSGCGKTTSLRLLAGLEEISEGNIYIGDRLVNDVPPKDRDIAMVFQSYALYPHMSVYAIWPLGSNCARRPSRILTGAYTRRPVCWVLKYCWTASPSNSPAGSGSVLRWVVPSCANHTSF